MRKCITSTERLRELSSKSMQMDLTSEILEIAGKIQKAICEKREEIKDLGEDYTEPKVTDVKLRFEYVHRNGSRVLGDVVDVTVVKFETVKI